VNNGLDDLLREMDDPSERERLRKVHDLLLSVDPPPDVPPTLRAMPPEEPVRLRPRRVRPALVALAATLAALAFGAGYWVGNRDQGPVFVVEMEGTSARSEAVASIEILDEDKAGNWPMDVILRGLEPSRNRQDFYELWLTRDGKLVASCGRFLVNPGVTEVRLTVPYGLRRFNGWVVTRAGSDRALLTT
jgi:hypothetical protein